MDYKDVEQLLERYWLCETSLEEENQLREFFLGDNIPEELEQYREVFVYQSVLQKAEMSADFEERLYAAIDKPPFKIKKTSFINGIAPLFRAAVFVGVFILVNNLVQHSFFKNDNDIPDYNYDDYKDTHTDPEVAYKKVSSALMIPSEELKDSTVQKVDTFGINRQESVEQDE
jgi:hypothetical protein